MIRLERPLAAATGLLWAGMTACALSFLASPYSWVPDASAGNAFAAAWAVLFILFESCVAVMAARGKGRGARAAAAATAVLCMAAAVLIAVWGAGEAASKIPLAVC